MKKLILKALFLTFVVFAPVSAMAEVNVHINIPLPPLIIFPAPPEMVVIPETDVYAVPDVQEDIFFYSGWWWRPWEGRWYRSHYYDRGWAYYNSVPSFYRNFRPGWRNDYRNHRWRGHQWDYQRIPHRELQRNWQGWQRDRHWEKQNNWGVRGLPPRQHPQGMVKHEPQQYRDTRQPREVRPQPGLQQHYQGEVRQHNGPPPRDVRPQSGPVQSREMKAQGKGGAQLNKDRQPSGKDNHQGGHEGEQQEGQGRR